MTGPTIQFSKNSGAQKRMARRHWIEGERGGAILREHKNKILARFHIFL